MATRYGASSFSRTARSAFNSFRNSSASQSSRTPRRTRNLFENGNPSMNRRRLAETMIPLHNAAACAKLVTHLSVSSRSCRSLASGFSHLMNYTLGIKQVLVATKDEGSIWSVVAKGRGLCCDNCWVEATSPNPFPSLTEKIIPAIKIRQKPVQKSVQLCTSLQGFFFPSYQLMPAGQCWGYMEST